MSQLSAGTRFRQAVKESNPLAVVGCVNAYFCAAGDAERV